MEANLITASAGLLGSLIGGAATVSTTWVSQRSLHKRELVQVDMRNRELLYGEFISECARHLMYAATHTLDNPETVLPIYAMMNRIRLCASEGVLSEAEHLLQRITDQYFSRNLTVEEMRQLARPDGDPLKSFGEACRSELQSMRRRA